MSPEEIIPVINTWIDLYNTLKSTTPYTYAQIFENKGSAMGCSNPHPHCQVWTTDYIPTEPLTELHSLKTYREHRHSCLLCDYANLELDKGERVVLQQGIWIAVCPYWANWPFEILLLPTKHIPAISDLTADEILDFAKIISGITVRFDNLFETSFPYSMGIHQAPLKVPAEERFESDISHLHLHFYPPLLRSATVRKFLVGYFLHNYYTHVVLKCWVSHKEI